MSSTLTIFCTTSGKRDGITEAVDGVLTLKVHGQILPTDPGVEIGTSALISGVTQIIHQDDDSGRYTVWFPILPESG